MRMMRLVRLLAGALLLGCWGSAGPAPSAAAAAPATIKVITQNLYLGADLGLLEGASLAQLPAALAQFWAQVQSTNFPERAEKLADEIAAADPHLIGLPEATLWRSGPRDGVGNLNGGNATDIEHDFIQILLDKLADRGKPYAVAAVSSDADHEFTVRTSTGLRDIRRTDRTAILMRTDLPEQVFTVASPQAQRFNAVTTRSIAGITVSLPRSWVSVDATVRGQTIRFVATHLNADPAVQEAQGAELLAGPLNTSGPAVLVGDLNSSADPAASVPGRTDTATYGNLLAAGFSDAWLAVNTNGVGNTCCQSPDLRNDPSNLQTRIDYILMRGGLSATATHLIGTSLADRTWSGMWPSDHAGLVSLLQTRD